MARNVAFQVLRGTYSSLLTNQTTSPLAWGEMYFGTDTGNLYFGTPGTGLGFITIGDTSAVNDRLDQLIVIMEAVRRALVVLACKEGHGSEQDFDLAVISEELASSTPIGR